MVLVLDTSILIHLERKERKTINYLHEHAALYPSAKVTFMNRCEFLRGIRQKSAKNKEQAIALLNKFSVFHTTDRTAEILADMRIKYEQHGRMLPLADLIVAALTIENNGTLLTTDQGFTRIKELKCIVL